MRKTKLHISGGGTLTQNATSNRSLRYHRTSIRMAHAAGNKVMLYGCGSIGPIRVPEAAAGPHGCWTAAPDRITLRDDKCGQELRGHWRQQAGMAYHSRPGAARSTEAPAGRRCRGSMPSWAWRQGRHYAMFVLRPWQNFSAHVQDFAQAAQWLYDTQGLVPVFFAMEPARDLRAMDQVIAQLHCRSRGCARRIRTRR